MDFVEERTVGPSLGAENIQLGVMSVQIGLALVAVFMLVYYRVFGVVAVIGLSMNLVLLIALMSMLSATLTLPGIAGIITRGICKSVAISQACRGPAPPNATNVNRRGSYPRSTDIRRIARSMLALAT